MKIKRLSLVLVMMCMVTLPTPSLLAQKGRKTAHPSRETCCEVEQPTGPQLSEKRLAYLLEVVRDLNTQTAGKTHGVLYITIQPGFPYIGMVNWPRYRKHTATLVFSVEVLSGSEADFSDVAYHEFAHVRFTTSPTIAATATKYFDVLTPEERMYFKENNFLANEMGHPDCPTELFASAMALAALIDDGLLDNALVRPSGNAYTYWQWIRSLPRLKKPLHDLDLFSH